MRARIWLRLGCMVGVAAAASASCADEPGAFSAEVSGGGGEELPLTPAPDAGSAERSALCRTDLDCAITERCCDSGLYGLCSPIEAGRECATPDLVLTLPPDFKPRFEYRLFEEGDCLLDKCVSGPGARRLLRFPLNLVNRGSGPIIMALPDASGVQRIECDGSLFLDGFLRYELVDAQGARRAGGVGDAALACRVDFLAARTSPFDCETLGLEEHSYRELASDADCQWVDITTLPPGQYTLRLSVNADARLKEGRRDNNDLELAVTIPAADPLAPCNPDDLPEEVSSRENLECGWEMIPGQTGLTCEPGARVELDCTICEGAYLPRACPDLEPCSAAGSLRINGVSYNPVVCSAAHACEGSAQCMGLAFTCPASGRYSLLGFPTASADPFSITPAPSPRSVVCGPPGPDDGSSPPSFSGPMPAPEVP